MELKNWNKEFDKIAMSYSGAKPGFTLLETLVKLKEHFKGFGNSLLDELEMEIDKVFLLKKKDADYWVGRGEVIKENKEKIKSLRELLK